MAKIRKWKTAPEGLVSEYLSHQDEIYKKIEEAYDHLEQVTKAHVSPNKSIPKVADAIEKAVAEQGGFSAIRMNDGEGNVLAFNSVFYPESAREYSLNKIFDMMFYGDQRAYESREAVRSLLIESVSSADIIGIPPRKRALNSLGSEQLYDDLRGQSGSHQVAIELAKLSMEDEVDLAEKLLVSGHFSREINDRYPSIFAGRRYASFIGCHRDLPELIRDRFGFHHVKFYELPNQPSNVGLRDFKGDFHFSDVFPRLKNEIEIREPGEIFLVAAGLLGKSYCTRVKERGGVAIDIGSLADAWCGVPARPYIRKSPDKYSL